MILQENLKTRNQRLKTRSQQQPQKPTKRQVHSSFSFPITEPWQNANPMHNSILWSMHLFVYLHEMRKKEKIFFCKAVTSELLALHHQSDNGIALSTCRRGRCLPVSPSDFFNSAAQTMRVRSGFKHSQCQECPWLSAPWPNHWKDSYYRWVKYCIPATQSSFTN